MKNASTDFWQRTYYGFQNDNAPALLMKTNEQYFLFLVKTEVDSKHRFKASIEYEIVYLFLIRREYYVSIPF